MGKADTPPPPDYKGQAIATANLGKYSEQTPFGSVIWAQRPGADPLNPQAGDDVRTTMLSPEQQQLYQQQTGNQLQAGRVGQQLIGELGGGTQGVQDALYRRATQYYGDRFGDEEAAMRARLENSGLTAGGTAYDRELRNFGRMKNTAYADATDRAITGADASQNSAVSRLAQILAMSRGQAPTSGNNTAPGADLLGATQGQHNAQLARVNAENANTASTTSTVGSLAAMAAIYF